MKVIYKYPLEYSTEQFITAPESASFLGVGVQANNQLVVWALVNTSKPDCKHVIRVHGTGHTLSDHEGGFVGTAQDQQLGLVWHVFYAGVLGQGKL